MVRGQLDVVGSYVACVHKVGGIPNHGPVYPEPLVVAPSPGTLRLVEAAREPLQPDIARTGHLTALQFSLHPGSVSVPALPRPEFYPAQIRKLLVLLVLVMVGWTGKRLRSSCLLGTCI